MRFSSRFTPGPPLAAHVVDPLPHGRREPLDVVVLRVRGVRQQRPDGPGSAACRGPDERRPIERSLDLGHCALDRNGQSGPGGLAARRETDRAADRAAQGVEPGAGGCDRGNDLDAEPSAEPGGIHRHAGRLRLVDHVQGDDDRDAGLDDLQHQVEPALEGAGVDDDHDRFGQISAPAENLIDRHLLVERVGAEAVGAGQVDDLRARPARKLNLPRGTGDGHARVVADTRPRPRQRIEYGGLAGVGVAGDEDARNRCRGPRARGMGGETDRRRRAARGAAPGSRVAGSASAPGFAAAPDRHPRRSR